MGLHKQFDENGYISRTFDYIYPKQENKDTLTGDVFTYIIDCEYYPNGQAKWKKIYANYIYAESAAGHDDDENKVPLGTWEFYDEKGNLVEKVKHSDLRAE